MSWLLLVLYSMIILGRVLHELYDCFFFWCLYLMLMGIITILVHLRCHPNGVIVSSFYLWNTFITSWKQDFYICLPCFVSIFWKQHRFNWLGLNCLYNYFCCFRCFGFANIPDWFFWSAFIAAWGKDFWFWC